MENKKILRFLSKDKIYLPDTPKEASNHRLSRSHTDTHDNHEKIETLMTNSNDIMFLQNLENRRKIIILMLEGIMRNKVEKIDIQFFKLNPKIEEMKEVSGNNHIN
jgi:hypothetical protein